MSDLAQMSPEDTPDSYMIFHRRVSLSEAERKNKCHRLNALAKTMRSYANKGYAIVLQPRDMDEIAERIEWLEGKIRAHATDNPKEADE